jgi:hypothetical protein
MRANLLALALTLLAAAGCMIGIEEDAMLDVDGSVQEITYTTINSQAGAQIFGNGSVPYQAARCRAMAYSSNYFNVTSFTSQLGNVCDGTGTVVATRVRCATGSPPCQVQTGSWGVSVVPQCGNVTTWNTIGSVTWSGSGPTTLTYTIGGQTHTCNTLNSTYTKP